MPIATPEKYAEMLDAAKAGAFAYPGDQRLVLADPERRAAGLRRGRLGRHHPGLDRRRGVPLRPDRQEHGHRLGGVRGVRRRGGQELPGQHRAAHRPLPARTSSTASSGRCSTISVERVGRGEDAAVPVAHVGRLRRAARGEPADRRGAARDLRQGARSSSRSRSAWSAARRTASSNEINEKLYTTPEDALATVAALGTGENGRYLTALTFGNVHGVYKPGNVKLRPEILKEAQEAVVAEARPGRRLEAVRPGLPRRLRLDRRGDRRRGRLRRGQDERRHRHPVRLHPAGRRRTCSPTTTAS